MAEQNSTQKINVLYLDDEVHNLHAFKATFRIKYNVFIAQNADEAKTLLAANDIPIIVSDQRMPEMTGVQFFESILPLYPLSQRIMLTGYADFQDTVDAVNKGKICQYLNKPWTEQLLDEVMQKAYQNYLLEVEKKNKAERTEIAEKERDKAKEESDQMEFIVRGKFLAD